MKKLAGVLSIGALVLLASCGPSGGGEEEVKQETADGGEKTSVVSSYNFSDEEYKVLLPYESGKSKGVVNYETSAARGVIINQIANRLDIDEVEEGLRNHSKDVFSPDDYYFREGQMLDSDTLYSWIGRYAKAQKDDKGKTSADEEAKELGLNPELNEDKASEKDFRDNPKYLSHILEQDYMVEDENGDIKLGGVSIALAMKSEYQFTTGGKGPYREEISEDKMLAQANEMSKKIVERMRDIDGLSEVPIHITVYQEAKKESVVPGNFVAETTVDKGSSSVGDWDKIDEDNVLFPSDAANENHPDESQYISAFTTKVASFFPNYTGMVGRGFYQNDELKKLTIDIPIQFEGNAEVVAFTQYAYSQIMDIFPNYYDLEINITSNDQTEAIITREHDTKEPEVYILN
ncbi:CamS family sex pheromone protein [Terribacillus saccharophilus]|uniref:CamS family sex pheromone protein n=1 Tax=Terribacillus saccharophilus TaxID=361277 RepID=UPI002DCE8D75|nr:CamS family sex pheromone protein [Terribacillus saccharophilus]MEC0292009.1 CamS family sex pheromone protein [Terribacillus saccharophilus]